MTQLLLQRESRPSSPEQRDRDRRGDSKAERKDRRNLMEAEEESRRDRKGERKRVTFFAFGVLLLL